MNRSIEDKKLCYNHGPVLIHHQNNNSNNNNNNNKNNIINNNNNSKSSSNSRGHRSTGLGKLSAPSKWDDAQKWLVNLSRKGSSEKSGHGGHTKPRNSNADDLRLIAPVDYHSNSSNSNVHNNNNNNDDDDDSSSSSELDDDGEGEDEEKKTVVDPRGGGGEVAIWRINRPRAAVGARAVCVRDMGTEMTPIASQEPSRTGTPVRGRTPAARSPISSGCSTPIGQQQSSASAQIMALSSNTNNNNGLNPLETRAVAWDEAERAKYMARYKREEVKIQAWENHEKRKAEMEMKKMEVKAERIKARAEEKMTNKLAATRRIAEERRTNAEAKLNEKAMRTSERADYIRRTGHLPSSLSFKLPSLNCW